MKFRIMFQVPQTRPPIIGNEVEDGALIDLDHKKVIGSIGGFTELPADPKQPAKRLNSKPISINLTDADVALIKSTIDAAAHAQGVVGKTRYETKLAGDVPFVVCRVDPYRVTLPPEALQAIIGVVFTRAREQGIEGMDGGTIITIDGVQV